MEFLGKTQVDIPQGGLPAGFTGQWMAAVRYTFLVEGEPTDYGLTPDSYRQTGSWYAVYYAGKDAAAKAAIDVGQQYAPKQVWLFEAPISTVMLPEDIKSKFGASISMESVVKTLGSRKYRHEFHLISLPAAVAAYAQLRGWYDADDYILRAVPLVP